MSTTPTKDRNNSPPPEYEAAMSDLEERAARGELTMAQARRAIFELRDRFCAGPEVQRQWAAQAGSRA